MACRKSTWLDIGCGHGELIEALRSFSNENVAARGVEPNANKQRSAQRKGLDVTYFDLDHHDAQYDFVSLLNVYSHLPDPGAALTDWKRLLKLNGELFLETGDTSDLPYKFHPKPFLLPDHLGFASEAIVSGILEEIWFEILQIKKYPRYRFGMAQSVKEAVKICWPGKRSKMYYMIKRTDMYVRARLSPCRKV